jgi:hypothetical protein
MAPTLQFLIAVFVFGEPFRWEKQVSFALEWVALIVLTVDSLLSSRRSTVKVVPAPVRTDELRESAICSD